MASATHQLLIASPQLIDPRFRRTVILMLEHHEDGAMGVILNRETTTPIGEIWEELEGEPGAQQMPVSVGGPVSGPFVSLHSCPELSDSEIMSNVYLATSTENVRRLIQQGVQPMRIFSGYSGWGPGQLESEIECGGWTQVPATTEHVFCDDLPQLWQNLSKSVGQQFWTDTLGIENFPTDSGLN